MSRNRDKATEVERSIHRERKANRREQASARIENLRDWIAERRIAAQKRERDRRVEREEMPRGIHRVPPLTKGNPLQRKPRGVRKAELMHTVSKHGTPITYGKGVKATKVHQRPPRRRELTDHAISQMTEAELKRWMGAKRSAVAKGYELTSREETALAWNIMAKRSAPAGAR